MLRIVEGSCPNLLHEAGLYQWNDVEEEDRSEMPVDRYNHALSGMRYLINTIDEHRPHGGDRPPDAGAPPKKPKQWLSLENEQLWTPVRF
jgi:hypothetical protein